jgi:hypothetical protein
VYVRPFPGPGGRWQISTGGGASPTWSRRKRELFYGSLNGQIMVAPFAVEDDSSRAETPRLWSDRHFVPRGPNRVFDLHPDGERFAVLPDEETGRSLKQDHGGRGQARATPSVDASIAGLLLACRQLPGDLPFGVRRQIAVTQGRHDAPALVVLPICAT